MAELLSCPFCGTSDKLTVTVYQASDDGGEPFGWGFTVICNAAGFSHVKNRGCGASGAWGETEAEAIAAWNQRSPALIAELQSYRSEGVIVKPLDWSSYGGMRWRAKSPLGRFTVNPDSDRRFYVSVNGDPVPGRHATSDAAMAAAQLDYEARIKSALSPSTERAETIEECARIADEMSFQWSITHHEKGWEDAADKIAAAIRALNPSGSVER